MRDDWDRFNKAMTNIGNAPIQLSTQTDITIDQVKAKARYWIEEMDVKVIYLDYLQLCSGSSSQRYQNRDQEIGTISKGLKTIAKEYNIPVTALCQLSRPEKNAKYKRPTLSDLRESGNIEQDADIVEFLERPDYENSKPDPRLVGLMRETIAKNRNGSLGTTYLRYQREYNYFEELTYQELQQLRDTAQAPIYQQAQQPQRPPEEGSPF